MISNQKCLLLTYGSRHPFHFKPQTSKSVLTRPCSPTQYLNFYSYSKLSKGQENGNETINWPEVTSTNTIPSPYEIFNQKKHSPYSKQRFYELVKLYHPDRYELNSEVSKLSSETRLERYRLVVAANNILADPVKRNAYDRYGAGWNGNPDILKNGRAASNRGFSGGPRSYDGPDGLNQNATWEDWEKWYTRDAPPQDPIYVSNAAFFGIILIFALLGGIGQATRASSNSFSFMEQRNALHNKVSLELMNIRKESTNCSIQEERIHRFMKNRDPTGYNPEELRDENLRKLLKSSDRCSQGKFEVQTEEYKPNNHSNNQKNERNVQT
ncbi:hypothetical protein HI914_06854 [Erysiphe necator]|uniref:Putative hsp40p co-chaperone n=1 Tax=Uncinula necator TaxID=52586 RepID=A0A0B1P671_UNCNE|nr:hypothetical protein HI914_06854 [Erysiphe necator]KHJ32800.1 putative hsp40p co-chaperone [Erysiphe necator]